MKLYLLISCCVRRLFIFFSLLFSRFDQESSSDNQLYLDCFCVVASGIGVSITDLSLSLFLYLSYILKLVGINKV